MNIPAEAIPYITAIPSLVLPFAVYSYIDDYVEEFLCHWFFAGEYGNEYTPDQYGHLYGSGEAPAHLKDKEALRTALGRIGRFDTRTTINNKQGE